MTCKLLILIVLSACAVCPAVEHSAPGTFPGTFPENVPVMGIGLGDVSFYTPAWQFVDMMRYSREWRCPKGSEIIEDEHGWPIALKGGDGKEQAITPEHAVKMYMYNRYI